MTRYEREVKDYCRRAGGLLACGRTQRREFDRLTAQSVRDYLQEAPDASWMEVEQILGSPQDAADAFMESMPPDTAERWAGARKRRLRLTLGRCPQTPPASGRSFNLSGYCIAGGGHCLFLGHSRGSADRNGNDSYIRYY